LGKIPKIYKPKYRAQYKTKRQDKIELAVHDLTALLQKDALNARASLHIKGKVNNLPLCIKELLQEKRRARSVATLKKSL
jgi:hypothetical protein